MKKPRKLTVISSHHDDNLHPLMNDGPATAERLAHSRESPRAADAEETFKFQVDSIVHCYLDLLYYNLVEAPDALIELTARDDHSITMFRLHLALFLLFAGLAEEEPGSPCCIRFVATKKLLRGFGWLDAGDEPDERAIRYSLRLTLNAFRFLEEARLSGMSEKLMGTASASSRNKP
jgi:hypothetical protein